MTMFEEGDILLIDLPFTDLSGSKQRPALVLLDVGDQDVLVARVTTQTARSKFDVSVGQWRRAGLLAPSCARVDKLITISKARVIRRLGRLLKGDRTAVGQALTAIFAGWLRP